MPCGAKEIALIENDGQNQGSALSSFAIAEKGNSIYHRTTVNIAATSVGLTDNGSVNGAAGHLPLYSFPLNKHICILGAVGSITLSRAGTNATNISAAAPVQIAVGNTFTDATGSSLTGLQTNILQAGTMTLSSGTKSQALVTNNSDQFLDGTSANGMGAYMHFAIPAANSTGATTLTVSGFVKIAWADVGGLTV